jgi:DNA repair exonuclease SbcCD ATPase subunit
MSYNEAMAKARAAYPDAFQTAQPQRTGVGAALSKGFEGLVSSGRTGIESLLGSPEEAAKRGMERGQAIGEKYGDQVSLEKVKKAYEEKGVLPAAGEAASQVPAALAEQAPNIAATAASARAGQKIGKFFGPAGQLIGAGVGAAIPGLTQAFGSNVERQAAEQQAEGKPIEINRAAAGAAAVPQAALDVAGTFIPLGGRLVSMLTGVPEKALLSKSAGQVQKLADEKLYATLAKGLGTGLLAEIPTEVAQQMLERAQAGLSLTDTSALKEYGETAYQVSLLAPMGAAGRVASRSGARSEIQQKQETEMADARRQATEAEAQKLADMKAREGTSEYALEVKAQFEDILAKRAELDKVANAKTAEGDLLGEQAKRDARAERKKLIGDDETKRLISEYNRLKGTGIYEQIEEKERVSKISPMDYLLENTGTVSNAKTKAVEPDMGGLYEQQIVIPSEERRKAEAAEKARVAGLPAAYAEERIKLAQEQRLEPTGDDYVEYLLQDPYKASLLVESRTQLPGLTANESSLIRNTLARRLKAMSKEELTARQAELQGQRVGAEPTNPMTAFMEQSEGLDVDRRQGLTDADIAFAEKQAAMPTKTTTQGELFGGAQQRVNMPQAGTPADISAQIAELEKQLDVAKSYGAPDSATRPGDRDGRRANRERVSTILEQIKDLKDRQAKIAAGAPMGGDTDAVRAYIAAGTPDRKPGQTIEEWYASLPENAGTVSALPEQEKAQREAAAARTAAAEDVILNRQQDRREAVVGNLLKEIQTVRGRLKPETITQITRDVDAILDKPEDSDAALRALDDLSARWRAGVKRDTFGATTPTPTQTSEDMLREQMDRAFAQRQRYDTETLSILDQIAENFKAFNASPERRNMAGEWLNRVTQTGRSSPEMTADVRNELATLERGKRSETETPTRQTAFGLATKPTQTAVQGELDAELMPEAVAPQSETRIVNGKVQYISPEDKGPLQGSAAERYAPMQKGTIFNTPEELDAYLSSDYLKEARENQGLARETVSRLSKQVTGYETSIADLQKQIDALQERKDALKGVQVSERRVADNLIADTEVQLTNLLKQLNDDLAPIRMSLEQAEINLVNAEARSEETSRLIANNFANFKYMDEKVARAAQATVAAKAELRRVRNKLGSLEEKRPLIEEAQRKVIDALQRQRNPLLYEMQEKMQELQKQQSLARVTQPRTVERIQKEIDELEDLMDMQMDNPYVPSSAMNTFLINDRQLHVDAREDRQKIGAAKRSVGHFKKKLDKAASDLKVDISTHPEIKALREQLGTAKELGTDALRGVEGELALLDDEMEKLEIAQSAKRREADNIEDQIIAAGEERTFAGQLAGTTIPTVSAIDRAETLAKDKKALEDFQGRTERLNALPGQRIDFSKRQEMLELVNASTEDFAKLDADIEAMQEGVDELQVRDHFMHEEMLDLQDQAKSFRGPRKNSKEGKAHFAKMEAHKKKMAENTDRIQSLRSAITQYEKTRATKQVALAKAESATSSDPEIYQEITKSIDARMAKLEKTITGKEAAVVKGDEAILKMARDIRDKADEGKTTPEKLAKMRERLKVLKTSQADRVKHLKEYVKERDVLKARRSNRLGITRTDVLTGESVAGGRGKKASITEQEQFDAEIERRKELARAQERKEQLDNGMAALKKAKEPKTEEKKTERANRIAKLQDDINKQQALIDSLQPKEMGAVSQATKIESSAPGKFRAGTAETKADKGISRRPIVETRTARPITSEKAVADANAFAQRLSDAKTPASLDAEFAAKEIETQNQVIEAVESNISRFQNMADTLASELLELNSISAKNMTPKAAERRDKVRTDLAYAERLLDRALEDRERLLKVQEEAEVAAPADQEEGGLPSGFKSFTGQDTIGNEGIEDDRLFQLASTNAEGPALEGDTNIDGKSAAVVMRNIADTTQDPINKAVAERLKMLLGNTEVRLVDDLRSDTGVPVYGTAASNGAFIELDSNYGMNEQTALHEGVHAATERVISMPEDQLTAAQLAAKKELTAIYDALKADKSMPYPELLDSLSEFAAESLTSPRLRVYMQSKPWTLQHMWDAFKSAILKLLGVQTPRNMSEAAIAAVDRLMTKVPRATEADMQLAQPRLNQVRYANTALASAGAVADKTIAKQRGVMDVIKEEGTGLKLMTNMVDRFAPLEKLSKYMAPMKGLQMMYYLRMYDQRMNFVAQSVGSGALRRVEKTRKDGQKEYVLESSPGASLRGVVDILKDGVKLVGSAEGNSRLFSMYLVAKRAESVGLAKLNYGGKVTEADLQEVRSAIASTPGLKAIYDKAQQEYNLYNRDLLQFAVETGALSAKARADLIKNGDYVPYYRVRNGSVEMMLGGQSISQVGSVKEQPYLQELVGGEEPILDFMTSAVQNTNMLTDMSLRNLATKNAVFELQELGMATVGKGNAASGSNVVKFKVDGEDRFAMLDTEDLVVNGKKYATGIPADLVVKGMEGIPVQNTIITKLMGGPARALRKFVVLNPLYAARQLFRDSLAAPLLSGADFSPVLGALKEIGSDAGKTLERRGITGGQVFTGTQEDLTAILRQISSGESSFAQGVAKLESISMAADALTRRAQYNSYIKQGLSEMEATYMALESMNFGKRGMNPAMHTLSTVIPFFNAQVQSLNVLYKAFTGNLPFNEKLKIREKLVQRGMMLAAMTMTYAALMQDEEEYKNATPEQKYGNWFVKLPGMEESLRIPIPFEIGYIFKAIPEAIVNSMMSQKGGEEAAKAFKQIALQIVPGGTSYGIPQAMKPLIEVGLGKSFYTGRDLESAHEQTLEPGQRARGTTTELARLVGEKINVSPIKIDALISGYLSTTGLALVDALSFALPTPDRPVEATKRLSEMRVIGSMFQPKDAGGIINATYERMKEAKQIKDTYNDMLKNGRIADAQRYLQENLQEYALAGSEPGFSSYMQKISKYEQAVRASSMSPDEKRQLLDQYRQLKIQFATSVRAAADKTAPR